MKRIIKMGVLLAVLAPLGACQIEGLAGPEVTAASPSKPSPTGKQRSGTMTTNSDPKTDVGTKGRYAMLSE